MFKKKQFDSNEKQKLPVVYGEVTVNDQMCEKWFATFHDSPRPGRRIEKIKKMPCLPASTGGT